MSGTLLNLSEEKARETSMVDLAFEILKTLNSPLNYRDLMKRVAETKGMSDEDIINAIAQLYTEINIDGRFACVGENLWGLKRWYPMDKTEGINAGKRFVNDDEDDEEDDDEFNYDDSEDDFDALDEDVDLIDGAADEVDEDDTDDEEEELDGFTEEDPDEDLDEIEESEEEDLD